MLASIPVYVEVKREEGRPVHHCRPVFFAGAQAADPHLGLAMSKLGKRLKQYLDAIGSKPRHDELAEHLFSPELATHTFKLSLELRERVARCKLLWVEFAALKRRIAFPPALPELWCEIADGESLENRAGEVLTHYFRQREKESRKGFGGGPTPESIALEGQAWVTAIDLDVKVQQPDLKQLERKLAALFDDTRVDGATELNRVGRCLDWLYPDELEQAVARQREVDLLDRLLQGKDLRPVVLVGPRLVGKTSVLHECVRRRVQKRGKPYAARRNVWLLSPQRLISGMMYVGQWEGRVEAILRTARRKGHVLYFDDFLGLYHAGISRDASLSVADVLKPYVLRREVRVLAELTPEAWQTLQEHDRGLADQFHVLRIEPTSEVLTRRVMLQVERRLEAEHRTQFDLDVLPATIELHQCYIRDAAFPGKSASFVQQLAQKYPNKKVTRREVYEQFHVKTGLSPALLDDRQRLDREMVVEKLREKVVGQEEAVQAAADVVAVAKARIADPGRPLATLLFLGPTGVGKTQCAKALAEVLFSSTGSLIRFDMNEHNGPLAAAQLIGTFGEPDGLLTAAVRRQPFAVVLLDEIEKAHPDVFDLLLQVLGEGRLTDALGRTADFSNTVVVMTSNLGTTAGGPIGLTTGDGTRRHEYVKAAESFFRPEFVNRIDRIIPFAPLSRDEMRRIADLLLSDVFHRDGLVRRRCALAVEDAAMQRIVDAGYHPQFGARALKRTIERQLIQPVAATLAGVRPELPAVIRIYPCGEDVTAQVQPLESVAPIDHSRFNSLEPHEQLVRVRQFVDRIESEIADLRPSGESGRGVSPEQVRYYTLREQLHKVQEQANRVAEAIEATKRKESPPRISPKTPAEKMVSRSYHSLGPGRRHLKDIQSVHDIHDYLRDMAAAAPRAEPLEAQLAALAREVAVLHLLGTSAGMPEQALLSVHWLVRQIGPERRKPVWDWIYRIGKVFASMGYQLEEYTNFADRMGADDLHLGWLLSGPGIWQLASAETGMHVVCRWHENLVPVQVSLHPANDMCLKDQIEAVYARRRAWLADLASGRARAEEDPLELGRIVRFYEEHATLDLRTGQTVQGVPTIEQRQMMLLVGLPLPPELER